MKNSLKSIFKKSTFFDLRKTKTLNFKEKALARTANLAKFQAFSDRSAS